jgi:hypothetical protein
MKTFLFLLILTIFHYSFIANNILFVDTVTSDVLQRPVPNRPFYAILGQLPNDGTALLVGRSRDRFPVVSLGIFCIATDRTMCRGVDSASKNEYQGFLLG